ncbi:protease complex subunit PrcB family protein [Flavobacterium sp.]|uniref:protease complex subunit PrcB family protein n=1 Tax=Flavobacterium sp. TaxID=239 RepID=UPI0038FC6136
MKKSILIFLVLSLYSCATTIVNPNKKPLYEVLLNQTYGGANIRFFEILSEPNEIVMLQKDPKLKNRINPNDVQTSNYVILNMGEKSTNGFRIVIENITETDKNIIISTKEIVPLPGSVLIQQITNPFCVVKINSKKEILFK